MLLVKLMFIPNASATVPQVLFRIKNEQFNGYLSIALISIILYNLLIVLMLSTLVHNRTI